MQPDTLSRDIELEAIQPTDAGPSNWNEEIGVAPAAEVVEATPADLAPLEVEGSATSRDASVQQTGSTDTARDSNERRRAPESRAASGTAPERSGVRDIPCDQCGGEQFLTMFEKESSRDEVYQVVRCVSCDLVQVNPQPDAATVAPYYAREYFTKRTDRGYDNYFSEELKAQINSVYAQNLGDLGFFEYEQHLKSGSWLMQHLGGPAAGAKSTGPSTAKTASESNAKPPGAALQPDHRPRSLDVGCAAGYFVQYLAERGWNAEGVELSEAAAEFGIQKLDLNILIADFLTCRKLKADAYDLISLWASIEHMHSPRQVLARAFELLKPGGRMILSTCRYGALAKLRGVNWRFMNVPEHLYFFSLQGLIDLARDIGFQSEAAVTYGSGLTGRPNASLWYRAAKRLADPTVKRLNQGDMMALHLSKAV
ncbi:MAG: class I SAM-dependent methyltransferase [bacterium]|nr:class I SAM-dependent methyltransferase [bacterium]